MSDTNRVAIRYRAESSYGVLPGSPIFKNLRFTGESLKQDTNSTQSQEIRADRAIADIIRTGIEASGNIDYELSYGAYDDFIAAVYGQSAFSAIHTLSALTTISAAAADNSLNDTANSFTTANGYVAGAWIKVSGFTGSNNANNRVWRIKSRTSDAKIILEGGLVVNDSAGEAVTVVRGGSCKTGTTLTTFTLEKEFTDLSNEFANYPGVGFDRMSMEIAPDGIITGSFAVMGQKEQSATATLSTGGSATAAPTNPVLNGIDNVTLIVEALDVVDTSFAITGFSFEIGNNLRTRKQVGTLGAVSIGVGTFDISGKISFYYTSKTKIDKYINWTSSNFAIVVGESSSSANTYVFDFPRIRFTDAQRQATGINEDVIVEASFQSYLDPTLGFMGQVVKFT